MLSVASRKRKLSFSNAGTNYRSSDLIQINLASAAEDKSYYDYLQNKPSKSGQAMSVYLYWKFHKKIIEGNKSIRKVLCTCIWQGSTRTNFKMGVSFGLKGYFSQVGNQGMNEHWQNFKTYQQRKSRLKTEGNKLKVKKKKKKKY